MTKEEIFEFLIFRPINNSVTSGFPGHSMPGKADD